MEGDVEMKTEPQAQPVVDPAAAEELKNQGNEFFKQGKYLEAINSYSQALEQLHTSNSRSILQLKLQSPKFRYKEALFDCEQAIVLNRQFLKAYQRAYKCYMTLGDLEKAREVSLISKDLGDDQALKQVQLMNTLIDMQHKARQYMHDRQYSDALTYCSQLVNYCPDCAKYVGMKIQAYIGMNKLVEAIEFSSKLQSQFIENPEYLFWRGKLLIYNSNMDMGKKYVREALNKDPDNVTYQKAWRNLSKMDKVKKEGADFFSSMDFKAAIEKFTECLELDPLNNQWNSSILFNRSLAYLKLANNKEALADLTKAIEINEDYAKAYLKRGELNLTMQNYEEAVRDFERVKQIDPSTAGISQKVQNAKLELKKSKRKDYYKLLEIEQTANEDEIKKAYRKKALMWHPDKHQNDDEEGKKHADKMFKDISEGYEILSDARKRNQYDQGADCDEINQGGHGGGGFHSQDPSEIFQMFFGGGGGGGGGHQHFFTNRGGRF
ncbi:dnaj heat shock n-terminal domain-containing protein [Stylonychia lemnae]|uniref:Dnaj heat shock n-terminal domain-containing protein n=1 Tax=Stylonychia lemnae TaxID=5949 RepID=A0A078AXV7_STYLE|nr:dnaj heat shock n-terminal domain-containing protein [Stylonychia lemnae]|eukprot:CDW86072.1 dnaj heat shock n-terminal domain-containing protein [Stylonychia lemnae]